MDPASLFSQILENTLSRYLKETDNLFPYLKYLVPDEHKRSLIQAQNKNLSDLKDILRYNKRAGTTLTFDVAMGHMISNKNKMSQCIAKEGHPYEKGFIEAAINYLYLWSKNPKREEKSSYHRLLQKWQFSEKGWNHFLDFFFTHYIRIWVCADIEFHCEFKIVQNIMRCYLKYELQNQKYDSIKVEEVFFDFKLKMILPHMDPKYRVMRSVVMGKDTDLLHITFSDGSTETFSINFYFPCRVVLFPSEYPANVREIRVYELTDSVLSYPTVLQACQKTRDIHELLHKGLEDIFFLDLRELCCSYVSALYL